MIGNHYIVREVARDLNTRLRGDAITELYTQEKDELVISFAHTPGALVLSCRRESNCCFLHPAFSRSRRNSTRIFQDCSGAVVTEVSTHPSDRMLSILLADGRQIVARFFGARANVLLVRDGTILAAFKDPARLAGTPYVPTPPAPPVDLTSLDSLAGPATVPTSILRKAVPGLGPALALEVVARAGTADVPGPHSEETITALRCSLVLLLDELEHPHPVLYHAPAGVPPLLSPVRLTSRGESAPEPVNDLHAAIRSVLYTRRSSTALAGRKEVIVSTLQRHLDRMRRTLDAVQHDLEASRRAEQYERFGGLLLEHLAAVPPGAETITLPSDGATVDIPLDLRLTPSQNAQRYFEKAKRSKAARVEAAERQVVLGERCRRASDLLAAMAAVGGPEALTVFLKEHATAMNEFGIGEKGEPREAPLFRIFTVEGGFEVWAGKSSENNDLLTLRHSRPNDLWFHARGSSGSHVILRVGSAAGVPGKRAKEQAAGIAAYFSKMKTARLVPVAMTERKYVRKPRGAKPGTVTIEREQVIFAVPRLPSPEEP
jgi:predicted ribosome quality control (RQC) complex YloA/Tae2 family protein